VIQQRPLGHVKVAVNVVVGHVPLVAEVDVDVLPRHGVGHGAAGEQLIERVRRSAADQSHAARPAAADGLTDDGADQIGHECGCLPGGRFDNDSPWKLRLGHGSEVYTMFPSWCQCLSGGQYASRGS